VVEGYGEAGILGGLAGVMAWMGVLDSPGSLNKTALQMTPSVSSKASKPLVQSDYW